MRYNEEMVDGYYFGNPCFAGTGPGDRLWTPDYDPNRAAFLEDVTNTEVGQQFVQMFDSADDIQAAWDTVLAIHQKSATYYGSDITVDSFVRCLRDAIRTRKIVEPAPVEQVEETDPTSAEWAEYYQTHTIEQSRTRARSDAGYAQFLQSWAKDNFDETLDTAAVTNLSRPDQVAPATNEVRRFAELYNQTSYTQLKPRNGEYVLSDGTKYSVVRFNELLSAATRSRLL
ncbi:MAG: hypothetical protein WBL50_11315 [Candidatus Acidiferrum sp.]